MARERITPGCVYKHLYEEKTTLGMVVWVGYHRHPITGEMEPACDILWQLRYVDRVFTAEVYETLEFMGRFKVLSRSRFPRGVNLRFGLNGDHSSPHRLIASVYEESPQTPVQAAVSAWKGYYAPKDDQ